MDRDKTILVLEEAHASLKTAQRLIALATVFRNTSPNFKSIQMRAELEKIGRAVTEELNRLMYYPELL